MHQIRGMRRIAFEKSGSPSTLICQPSALSKTVGFNAKMIFAYRVVSMDSLIYFGLNTASRSWLRTESSTAYSRQHSAENKYWWRTWRRACFRTSATPKHQWPVGCVSNFVIPSGFLNYFDYYSYCLWPWFVRCNSNHALPASLALQRSLR